jgi:hypothetical protein
MTRRIGMTSKAWTGTAVLVAGSLLAACAPFGLAPDEVDSTSAVADKVKAASKADLPTPKFSQVPPRPTDVRKPETYRADVVQSVRARAGLDRWVQANPPLTTDATEAFAAQGQAALAAAQASLPSLDEGTADTEAFAERARERAAPPQPSK